MKPFHRSAPTGVDVRDLSGPRGGSVPACRADELRVEQPSGPWWASDPSRARGRVVRHRMRRALLALLVIAGCAGSLALYSFNPGQAPVVGAGGQTTAAPTLEALAEGCAGIASWPGGPADENGWLEDGATFAFRVNPAVSGNFAKTPWTGPSVVTPDMSDRPTVEQALSLQYRGWVVVWYRTDQARSQLDSLFSWARKLPADGEVLVAPWPLDSKRTWRADRRLFLTGWNQTEACLSMSNDVLEQFQAALPPAPGEGLPLDVPGPKAKIATATVEKTD